MPRRDRLRMLMRVGRSRALGLHDDINLFLSIVGSAPSSKRILIAGLGIHIVAAANAATDALTPVSIHLCAQNEVEHERECIPGCDERVVDLLRGGEQPGSTAAYLGHDGKGGELARAACAVVLRDLREFGEEGEWERAELCGGEHGRGRDEEGEACCEEDEDGGKETSGGAGWLGCCEAPGRGGMIVEDDEEGDEHVLYGEEEVLSVCGEGKAVPRGIGKGYGVGRRL